MWISLKSQLVKRGKSYVQVKPGDPIPEAEYWPNRSACERHGLIEQVADVAPIPEPTTVAMAALVIEEPAQKPMEYSDFGEPEIEDEPVRKRVAEPMKKKPVLKRKSR